MNPVANSFAQRFGWGAQPQQPVMPPMQQQPVPGQPPMQGAPVPWQNTGFNPQPNPMPPVGAPIGFNPGGGQMPMQGQPPMMPQPVPNQYAQLMQRFRPSF